MLTRPPTPPRGPGPTPPHHHGWHPRPPSFGPRGFPSPHAVAKISVAIAVISSLSHISGLGCILTKLAHVVLFGILMVVAHHHFNRHHHHHPPSGHHFGHGRFPWWRRHWHHQRHGSMHSPHAPYGHPYGHPPGFSPPGDDPVGPDHEDTPEDVPSARDEGFMPFSGHPRDAFYPPWGGPPPGIHREHSFGPHGPPPRFHRERFFGPHGPPPSWDGPPFGYDRPPRGSWNFPPHDPWMDQDYPVESMRFPPHGGKFGPPFHREHRHHHHPMSPVFYGPHPGPEDMGFVGPPPPCPPSGHGPPPFGPRFGGGEHFRRGGGIQTDFCGKSD